MTFKNAKSLTIVSVIVIICAIILLLNFRKKKANSIVVEQQQTEVGVIEPLQAETNTSQVDQNTSQSESLGGPEAILGYELISSQDISYSNENRMMYWIVLDVKDIPDEINIRATGKSIWKDGNTHWKEFTIYIYLPGMQTDQTAYAVCEFGPDGLLKFQINENTIQEAK